MYTLRVRPQSAGPLVCICGTDHVHGPLRLLEGCDQPSLTHHLGWVHRPGAHGTAEWLSSEQAGEQLSLKLVEAIQASENLAGFTPRLHRLLLFS
jgi:hypothetical protein